MISTWYKLLGVISAGVGKIEENTVLVSMVVTSLYINIPQEEGITTVCNAYETFYKNSPPIPTHFIRKMLQLILTLSILWGGWGYFKRIQAM